MERNFFAKRIKRFFEGFLFPFFPLPRLFSRGRVMADGRIVKGEWVELYEINAKSKHGGCNTVPL